MIKNLPANARDSGDTGSTPGSGRSQEEEIKPMDRGAWWVTVYGITKVSDTTEQLNNNNQDLD